MITITEQQTNKVLTFKTYEQLYEQIKANEDIRHLPDAVEDVTRWAFTRHSYRRAFAFYQYVAKKKRRKKGLDVLEICWGPSRKPLLLTVTPKLDMELLKRAWCHAYCEAHGYEFEVSETPSSRNENEYSPDYSSQNITSDTGEAPQGGRP